MTSSIPTKPVDMMTRKELISECKRLNVKGYSKWNKPQLAEKVRKNHNDQIYKHYKEDDSFFACPDIIGTIFSYIEESSIEKYRQEMINGARDNFLLYKSMYIAYKRLPTSEQRSYLNANDFIDIIQLEKKLKEFATISVPPHIILQSGRKEKYTWCRLLKYPIKTSTQVKELTVIIKKATTELNTSRTVYDESAIIATCSLKFIGGPFLHRYIYN